MSRQDQCTPQSKSRQTQHLTLWIGVVRTAGALAYTWAGLVPKCILQAAVEEEVAMHLDMLHQVETTQYRAHMPNRHSQFCQRIDDQAASWCTTQMTLLMQTMSTL